MAKIVSRTKAKNSDRKKKARVAKPRRGRRIKIEATSSEDSAESDLLKSDLSESDQQPRSRRKTSEIAMQSDSSFASLSSSSPSCDDDSDSCSSSSSFEPPKKKRKAARQAAPRFAGRKQRFSSGRSRQTCTKCHRVRKNHVCLGYCRGGTSCLRPEDHAGGGRKSRSMLSSLTCSASRPAAFSLRKMSKAANIPLSKRSSHSLMDVFQELSDLTKVPIGPAPRTSAPPASSLIVSRLGAAIFAKSMEGAGPGFTEQPKLMQLSEKQNMIIRSMYLAARAYGSATATRARYVVTAAPIELSKVPDLPITAPFSGDSLPPEFFTKPFKSSAPTLAPTPKHSRKLDDVDMSDVSSPLPLRKRPRTETVKKLDLMVPSNLQGLTQEPSRSTAKNSTCNSGNVAPSIATGHWEPLRPMPDVEEFDLSRLEAYTLNHSELKDILGWIDRLSLSDGPEATSAVKKIMGLIDIHECGADGHCGFAVIGAVTGIPVSDLRTIAARQLWASWQAFGSKDDRAVYQYIRICQKYTRESREGMQALVDLECGDRRITENVDQDESYLDLPSVARQSWLSEGHFIALSTALGCKFRVFSPIMTISDHTPHPTENSILGQ